MRWIIGMPLLVKLLLLIVLVSSGAWLALYHWQGQILETLLFRHLSVQLENRTQAYHLSLTRHIVYHFFAAKLLASQPQVSAYLRHTSWEVTTKVLQHQALPPWIEENIWVNGPYPIRYALLFDAHQQLREVYAAQPLPKGLPQSIALADKLITQAYLTLIDKQPFILAGQWVDEQRALLMLATPIDETVLHTLTAQEEIVALFTQKDTVLVSSNSTLLPIGERKQNLRFLSTPKPLQVHGESAWYLACIIPQQQVQLWVLPIQRQIAFFSLWIISGIAGVLILLLVWWWWRLWNIYQAVERVAQSFLGPSAALQGNVLIRLETRLQHIRASIERYLSQANRIAIGQYATTLPTQAHGDRLGWVLHELSFRLHQARERERTQEWHKIGLNHLNEKLSRELNCTQLAREAIEFLTTYLDAEQGMFYVFDRNQLHLLASLDYQEREQLANVLQLGQGPAGQAARERNYVLLEPTPSSIHPGLGTYTEIILAMPFFYKDQVKGVVEFAFSAAPAYESIDFLRSATQLIGVVVHSSQARDDLRCRLAVNPLDSLEG